MPTRIAIAAAMALAAGAAGGAQREFPPLNATVTVGVVRGDGMLLPIANHKSGAWKPLVPGAPNLANATVVTRDARTLAKIGWRLLPVIGGGAARAMTLRDRRTVGSHCSEQQVLETSERPLPKKGGFPLDTIGVALL